MSEKKFYVYEHWRPDRGECFYVGKGRGRRANDMGQRNRWHKFIQAKLSALGTSVEVKIIADGLDQTEAFAKEIERIAFWRNDGADLVNMTDGGDGASGVRVSQETRDRLSKALTGRKMSQEARAKMSKASIGNKRALGYKRKPHELAALSARSKGKRPSIESREKMRNAKLGRTLSADHKAKIQTAVRLAYQDEDVRKKCSPSPETIEKARLANIGRKQTPEHIQKKIAGVLGRKNSDATRQLMRESALRREARKRLKVSYVGKE